MKKLIAVILAMTILITLLSSCMLTNNTNTDTQATDCDTDAGGENGKTITDTQATDCDTDAGGENGKTITDTQAVDSDTGVGEENGKTITDTQATDSDTGTDEENDSASAGSLTNMTIVSKEHSYYTTLNEMEYKGEDFPNELGTYIKLIKTSEEFKTCFESENVEETFFENNYILALKIHEAITLYSYKMIGCYNLEYIDGECQISLDYYSQIEGDNEKTPIYPDVDEEINVVKFFVLPKTEIDAFDTVQNVKINKNLIDYPFSSSFAKHYGYSGAPKEATAWLITEENRTNLIESFDLYGNIHEGDLLVYFPFEMQGDIRLAKAELNGNTVNVVFENYTHIENDYVEKNDARYYLIENFQDLQNVPDDYEVSITVNVIYIPCTTLCESNDDNI